MTSAERIYQAVKQAILDGVHPAGARLKEDGIASEFGVSRTPVRDALRRLQSEGLVEVAANFGARVASWTEGELGEVAELRAMLEGYAAALAAVKITDAELEELREAAQAVETAARRRPRPDLEAMGAANLTLHRRIVAAARNPFLQTSLEQLWHMPRMIRKYGLFSEERLERSLVYHREILAALTARDPDWASQVMRAHLSAARAYDTMLAADEGADDAPGAGGDF